MPLRERKTRPQPIITGFFRLVDGMYLQGVSFEELEKTYFLCKKEIEEKEKEDK